MMRRDKDTLADLLNPKQADKKLVKASYYLTKEQLEKLDHFSQLTNRSKSEFLRDALNMVFAQLEEEQERKKKADEDSPT